MQSLSEEEKRQVLGTVLADQLSVIQDSVKDVPEIKKQLQKLDDEVMQLSSDIKIIKTAIIDITQQVNAHERQIDRLQTI
jgi:septal ring factor EnvC (AmiA/AmiB activator)